jgi:hypothetical protein
VTHEHAWTRLPDLLEDRDEPDLLAHVAGCHDCQRQLFLLGHVDRLLRDAASARRKERRRTRRTRWLRFPAGLVAVAAVALLVLFFPHSRHSRQFTLRTASGQPIGRAVLARADAENMSLSLVARGLPTRRGDVYVLWAGRDGRPATIVGHFMVDPNGACRARFNLPGGRNWGRFWVTPPGRPDAVVART